MYRIPRVVFDPRPAGASDVTANARGDVHSHTRAYATTFGRRTQGRRQQHTLTHKHDASLPSGKRTHTRTPHMRLYNGCLRMATSACADVRSTTPSTIKRTRAAHNHNNIHARLHVMSGDVMYADAWGSPACSWQGLALGRSLRMMWWQRQR